jgi:hypothetical protein
VTRVQSAPKLIEQTWQEYQDARAHTAHLLQM